MKLRDIEIRQFRNIGHLRLEPHPILNCFVGDNAQGKTSLIEAIHYLSALKSFRAASTADLVQRGKDGALLRTVVAEDDRSDPRDLTCRLLLSTNSGQRDGPKKSQRQLSLNEKPVSSSKFMSVARTVVFSPESLASIKYGPDLRRELVDNASAQIFPLAHKNASEFQRCLKQRNAVLRHMKNQTLDVRRARDILDGLNSLYLEKATEVTLDRLRFLDALMPLLRDAFWQITHVDNSVNFGYESGETPWMQRAKEEVFHRLSAELLSPDRVRAEEAMGTTLTGPHRHDLTFTVDGNDSRIYCSQGQQRALILAFKIAEIVYHKQVFGSFPLLLLDDVLSEFDEKKRRYLTGFLRNNEAQTFLTTTEFIPEAREFALFTVNSGQIIRQKDADGHTDRDQESLFS